MNTKSFLKCEQERVDRLKKLQLPHLYRKIGIVIAVVTFILLFVNAFTINNLDYRLAIKYGMLVGLLLVSISKEKIEDELIANLRMQSYTFAFIVCVAYTIVQPFINYAVDYFVDAEKAMVKDTGDFVILFILLCVQVFYFEMLKRLHQ